MDARSFLQMVAGGDEDAVRDALAADRSLVRAAADPGWSRGGYRSWTPLHEAISCGHEGVHRCRRTRGSPTHRGRTPLMIAVQGKRETREPGKRFDALIALLESAAR